MKTTITSIFLVLILSGCATIFNPAYQKVAIEVPENATLEIDGEEPKVKNNLYKLRRDAQPKQLTLKAEGYRDQNMVIAQTNRSWLYVFSVLTTPVLYLPMLIDKGPKAYNYPKEPYKFPEMAASLPLRTPEMRYVSVSKVSIDIKKEDLKTRYFYSYKSFLNKESRVAASNDDITKGISARETYYSDSLNIYLTQRGYIDTTRKAIKATYTENIYLQGKISGYTFNKVNCNPATKNYPENYTFNNGFMCFVDLRVDWEITDNYGMTLYKKTDSVRSDQYAKPSSRETSQAVQVATYDALQKSMISVMQSAEVKKIIMDKSQENVENAFSPIQIPTSPNQISDISKSTKGAVTVKTKNGFGSGFAISQNGYIITNYHVVSDTAGLLVRLNNMKEFRAKLVRASKIHDLALLKIEATDLTPLRISAEREIDLATEVYAVGTPTAEDLAQTISKGIISGLRPYGKSMLIQTDASINSGNSGGPLINKKGEVLGVVVAKMRGFSVEGVAFAIPAYEIFDRLKLEIK